MIFNEYIALRTVYVDKISAYDAIIQLFASIFEEAYERKREREKKKKKR